MIKPLVTILIPVYNGEEYIHRLLDSILIQDYSNLQVIIVNDGSIDKTEEVIFNYLELFNEKKIQSKYLKQNNSGQSVAIRSALNYVKGEFLTWPDSDDYYNDEKAISKFVNILINQEYYAVRCEPLYSNGKEIFKKKHRYQNDNIFIDCLFANKGFWFQPICYMINYHKYLELNPKLNFYCEKSAGQNWQFYLVIFYYFECKTIHDNFCIISERSDSHSRERYKDSNRILNKYNSYINTILSTLNVLDISNDERFRIKNIVEKQYYSTAYKEIYSFDRKKARLFYAEYKSKIKLNFFDIFKLTNIGIFLRNLKNFFC